MALGGRGVQVVGVAYFFLVLSTVSILLRCYVRLHLVKSFGIDDIFATLAWALFVINLSFVITAAYHGTGQHAADLPPAEIPVGLKWWWFCEPIFVVASMAIKFSIGIYLIRIAQKRFHQAILWTTIIAMEVFSFFFFFLFIFQCRPSAYFWTKYTGGKGSCINPDFLVAITYAYSAIACATDWIYAIMPVFILWSLQMDFKTKLSVGILIALGASASITTVIRIPYLKSFRDLSDFLYATTDVALWTTAELGICISATSLATLRPLFRKLTGGFSAAFSEEPKSVRSWANRYSTGHGYIRTQSRNGLEEYGLAHDLGRSPSAKTDIDSECFGSEDAKRTVTIPAASLESPSRGNTIECQNREDVEERERNWREQGIIKSTASTQMFRLSH